MSRHVKKLSAPAGWNILRKDRMFIKKPAPGPAGLDSGQSLDLTLRQLGIAKTAREIKRILNSTEVFVDGKRVFAPDFPLGIMAVLSFPKSNVHYRIMLDAKGRIVAKQLDASMSGLKIVKIIGKTMLSGARIQLNCGDGRCIITDKKELKVNDSLVIGLPSQEIREHLPFVPEAPILLTAGKRAGSFGVLSAVLGEKIGFKQEEKQTETRKENALVVGPSKTIVL